MADRGQLRRRDHRGRQQLLREVRGEPPTTRAAATSDGPVAYRRRHNGLPRSGRMTRVLVVDDEAPIRRALDTNLRARGYDVDLAGTGEEALDLAARHHPDVVVLDLGLPGIDGIDVVRGLRGWTNVPIVILSARGAEPDKIEALDAGADDYVAKPFGMDE